jgi:hypothetical protein
MTTSEMISLFRLKYDAADSSIAYDFTDNEIIQFLNDSQNTLVDMLYYQGALEDLSPFIRTYRLTSRHVNGLPYSVYFSLRKDLIDSNFRHYIDSTSVITKSFPAVSGATVENKLIPISEVPKIITTIGNKPMFNHCVIFESNTSLNTAVDSQQLHSCYVILGDAYTTAFSSVTVVYLINPSVITANTTSLLIGKLHDKIVELAVNSAVQAIYKSKVPEQSKKEKE